MPRALLPLVIVTHALCAAAYTTSTNSCAPNANPFDEILGRRLHGRRVSPLSEADMKSGSTSEEPAARAAAKAEDAPPADALEKPSVSIFFGVTRLLPRGDHGRGSGERRAVRSLRVCASSRGPYKDQNSITFPSCSAHQVAS